MKLAVKLTIALVLGIVVVMAIYAWIQISNEVVLSEADSTAPSQARPFRRARCGRVGVVA